MAAGCGGVVTSLSRDGGPCWLFYGCASCFYLKFAAQNGCFVLCVNWFPSLTVYEFVCVCVNRMNYLSVR